MKATATEICAVIGTAVMILFCALSQRGSEGLRDEASRAPVQTVLRASVRLPHDAGSLLPGYNYYLLERMAAQEGMSAEIKLENYMDADPENLQGCTEDIIVLPLADSASADKRFHRICVDSVCFWVIRKNRRHMVGMAEKFIDSFMNSDGYRHLHYIFTMTYNPFRAVRRKALSPYDDIIRQQADSLGWDWRMLAAVVYQESGFHIEASSPMGAGGLMQLLPETGKSFGAEDLADPSQNIAAGGRYLRYLHRQFRSVPASPEEHIKITLAAYNAGVGRILDCMDTARQQNIDPGYWDNLISVIPSMRDSSILDTVKLRCGTFQGYETIEYVDRVLDIYREFCRMCPEK